MARTLYALLVGIDKYQPPVPPLAGCVNDIGEIEEFLLGRAGADGTQVKILALRDEKAKRKAVIEGFTKHLAKAGKDDVALFAYAGHGSQEAAPEQFWPIEPDRLNETLVLYDSRQPGIHDLADKELAILIEGVAKKV